MNFLDYPKERKKKKDRQTERQKEKRRHKIRNEDKESKQEARNKKENIGRIIEKNIKTPNINGIWSFKSLNSFHMGNR